MDKVIVLDDKDNIAITPLDLTAKDIITANDNQIKLLDNILAGNKVAIQPISKGENIVKFGQTIGKAITDIQIGELVDKNNLGCTSITKASQIGAQNVDISRYISNRTFMGYRRENGKVGIRNDLFIIPTVGCITPLLDVMVSEFRAIHPDNGSFDNIVLLKHPYGCSQLGEDFEQTRQILCDAATHPNVGGVLVFGLGCENNQMQGMKETINRLSGINLKRMKFLVAQEVTDEFAHAQQMLEELNTEATNDRREPIPLKELIVGLQSIYPDTLASVTADRLLARLADVVNANGGKTVITGLPELAVSYASVVDRASDDTTAAKLMNVFNHMQKYYSEFNSNMDQKPESKDVTTLVEGVANVLQKGGKAKISDAIPYGDKVSKAGLSILEAPSNNLIASSAEAAADCQLIVTSTGAATPYASFVPSVKVATNSELANKKKCWIDFDGGQVLNKSFEEVSEIFIDDIISIASGKMTKNEQAGLHGLAILKIGVTE